MAGVIASWWDDNRYNLKTLAASGWQELLNGWIQNATSEDSDGSTTGGIDRDRLLNTLAPKAMRELQALEASRAELEAQLSELESEPDEDADEQTIFQAAMNADKAKKVKKKLNDLKKIHKVTLTQATSSLQATADAMTDDQRQQVVLGFMRENLGSALQQAINLHRNHLVSVLEGWHDKYHISLRELERERDDAAAQLDGFLRELGYAR